MTAALVFGLSLSLLLNVVAGVLLARAAMRLFQYDDICRNILPILEDYSEDLTKLAKGDLLIDNPEVLAFHRRNLQAVKDLDATVGSVLSVVPPRPKKPVGSRPVVE